MQRTIVSGFLAQAIEILQRAADQKLSRGSGAGQILDRVVDIEHQRIGELANVVEAPLGPGALDAGDAGFVKRDSHAGDQRCRNGDGRGDADFVSANKF